MPVAGMQALPALSGDRAEPGQLRQPLVSDARTASAAHAHTLADPYLDETRSPGRLAIARSGTGRGLASADHVSALCAGLRHCGRQPGATRKAQQPERTEMVDSGHRSARAGRDADSDRACAAMGGIDAARAALHARECQAANDSLRGEFEPARAGPKANGTYFGIGECPCFST